LTHNASPGNDRIFVCAIRFVIVTKAVYGKDVDSFNSITQADGKEGMTKLMHQRKDEEPNYNEQQRETEERCARRKTADINTADQ
jgi:hypothetical protein